MLNLLFFSSTLVLPCLIYLLLRYISFASSSKGKPLPPGPKPWPIVGNLLHMSKLPHISMASFSKLYGPIVSLRLGTQLVVVASSPTAAMEILKTNDRLLSARKAPHAFPTDLVDLDSQALIWGTTCSDGWKSVRALCRTELFSAKAVESQTALREKKVADMVGYLRSRQGEVTSIGEVAFGVVFNTLTNLVFSKDLVDYEHVGSGGRLKILMERMVDVAASPNIADFYPFLAGLDPQGIRGEMRRLIDEMSEAWEDEVKARRACRVDGAPKRDLLNSFLENGFDNDHINWLTLELLIAGSDTTIATVEWAMVELIRNKQVLDKVCEELATEMDDQNQMKESRISQLPYLHACVKETLRLHPPAPLLVPRRATDSCEVMNYTIPRDTQIFVNVWAMGRDPSVWEDPLSFKPERFLSSNMDYKGQHYEFLPFGGGRRICLGLNMTSKQIPLVLASLLHYFDWSLPNGEDPSKLDMKEKFGVILQKEQQLLLVPNKRS